MNEMTFPEASPANPFMDAALPTMADLISKINADEELSVVRRRNVSSSVRRFCAALGYEPGQVPANHYYYRQRLKTFHPLEAGVTKERWQTIKSDVNFALKLAGIVKGQTRGLAPLSSDWTDLKEALPPRHFIWGLSRLGRFCSSLGISPAAVDECVFESFIDAIRRETFKTNPERLHRDVSVKWNQTVDLVPEIGLKKVTLPTYSKTYTTPWPDLPEDFRADAEAWLASMSEEADLLSDTGPIKPLRPASIKSYRYAVQQAFAALLDKGLDDQSISSLAILVRQENAKAILKFYLDRSDGKTSSMVHGISHVLVLIATTWAQPDRETVEKLKHYRAQLAVRRTGLSPKPRNALRQFADAKNIEKILCLPLKIHDHLKRKSSYDKRDALLMQTAAALELLLMRPVRRKNIVELRLDENVIKTGKETFILLPSGQVKNDLELHYKLPRESAALLDFYVKKLLPLFDSNPKGWLFPGENEERHKCGEQFGRNFTKTIRELTGLYLYPHLTRHFGAYLYLNENPGAFEVVRRVLAHKSLTTTTRSYISFEEEGAVKLYDNLILRMRQTIQSEVGDDQG